MTTQADLHPASSTAATSSSNPTTATTAQPQDASGRQPSAAAASSAELAGRKVELKRTLRSFPDFPIPGIDFVDIMPLFANPTAHQALVESLELQIKEAFPGDLPDVIVGLDARGFLFGPGLALRMGVGFAAVRKKGKLPGPCVTAEYVKEYGKDLFQMQEDAIKEGQKVLIVDDIIATGKLEHCALRRKMSQKTPSSNNFCRRLRQGCCRPREAAQGPSCWLPLHSRDSWSQRPRQARRRTDLDSH